MYERERMSEDKHQNVTAALLSFSVLPSLFCPQAVQEPRYFLLCLSQSVSCPSPKHPRSARGHTVCTVPAIDAGSLMHTACISAASCRHGAAARASSSYSQAAPQLLHGCTGRSLWLWSAKGKISTRGNRNIIPVWSLSPNSLLLLLSMRRSAQLG